MNTSQGTPASSADGETRLGPPARPLKYNPLIRRRWLLARLREADGITYDDLCREVVGAYPHKVRWIASERGVRAVRDLLWYGLAVTEPDESVWLTEAGWKAANELALAGVR